MELLTAEVVALSTVEDTDDSNVLAKLYCSDTPIPENSADTPSS